MNDLDLRAALHRDADLAGEPPADLLDQLVRRRRDQRRRRAGAFGGIAAVVVLAAGIPIGASLLSASDGRPAAPATTPTTEVVPSEVPPTTSAPVPPPVTPETPQVPLEDSEAPEAAETVTCPDVATLDAAMPADTSERRYTIDEGTPVCSGTWATVPITEHTVWQGEWTGDGAAAVFRSVDGAWTLISTTNGDRSPACDDPAIPAVIWERGCAVD
jgi:hypothetical protein